MIENHTKPKSLICLKMMLSQQSNGFLSLILKRRDSKKCVLTLMGSGSRMVISEKAIGKIVTKLFLVN